MSFKIEENSYAKIKQKDNYFEAQEVIYISKIDKDDMCTIEHIPHKENMYSIHKSMLEECSNKEIELTILKVLDEINNNG